MKLCHNFDTNFQFIFTKKEKKMSQAKQLNEQASIPYAECLNVLETNVLYCDSDLKLVFMNEKSVRSLEDIEDTIKEKFGFGVDGFIGRSIDEFHINPSYQRKMLKDLKNFPIASEISLGHLTLSLNIQVVMEGQKPQGYVVNWEDVSAKKEAQNIAARTQNMVDLSPINTMMASPDGEFLYMNKASMENLTKLKDLLPAPPSDFVGNSIDWFHKNPKGVRKIIKDPNNLPYSTVINVGKEKLR